ncbi:MAG: M48 family metallopeptidase [Xenococcaceae cyanobacterium MO_188.B19]|nr:M48 family metallopeptidase [Xenococcaceae cyanobacterium MO_188.B19]
MSRLIIRLGIGLLFAIFGLINYFGHVTENPVTGEQQRVQLSPKQEIVLGRQSRDRMIERHNGLYPDPILQAYINRVGNRIVKKSTVSYSTYPFQFYLLQDKRTVNAFALPGGQVFLTAALLSRLNSEAQLAGVLGHEVAHVVARHGAEHLAKQQLGAAISHAVTIAASDSSESARQTAILARAINQMINLKYGRQDELESDRLGVRFMIEAGYNPRGIMELMKILDAANKGAKPPEFFSTHPDPGNRISKILAIIQQKFPNGIPKKLEIGKTRFRKIVGSRL